MNKNLQVRKKSNYGGFFFLSVVNFVKTQFLIIEIEKCTIVDGTEYVMNYVGRIAEEMIRVMM